jgi:serine/threonine protein kinase
MDIERNLLYGVLAYQAEFVGLPQLADVCSAWATRKERFLGDILQDRGYLTSRDRSYLDYLLERRVKRHGSSRAALASAAEPGLRAALSSAVRDREVQRALADLPPYHAPSSGLPSAPRGRERFTLINLTTLDALAQTWTARDEELGREVAIKELRPEVRDNPSRQRFEAQARLLGQLEHPNILPLYELGHNPSTGLPYCTLRQPRGRPLHEAIQAYHAARREGQATAVEFRRLVSALLDVCRAVACAHARLIVHLDLRPHHILLGEAGEATLADWSKACRLSELFAPAPPAPAAASASDATAAPGATISPYSAPEQVSGRLADIDASTDVYALGAILYEILTGQPPFPTAEEAELQRQIETQPPPLPHRLVPDVPRALEAVALKALSKKRGDRYGRAGDLAAELERWLADEPVAAWTEPWPLRLSRWTRRHHSLVPAAYGLTAVVVLSLCIVIYLSARGWSEAHRRYLQAREDRQRSEFALIASRRAVDQLVAQLTSDPLLQEGELLTFRRNLLAQIAQQFAETSFLSPSDPDYHSKQAEISWRTAQLYAALGKHDQALAALWEARKLFHQAALDQPRNYAIRLKLAQVEGEIGQQWKHLGNVEEAETVLRCAVAAYDALPPRAFTTSEACYDRIRHMVLLAGLLLHRGNDAEAEQVLQLAGKAFENMKREIEDLGQDTAGRQTLVSLRLAEAATAERRGHRKEAERLYRLAVEESEVIAARDQNYRTQLLEGYLELARFLEHSQQLPEALDTLRRAASVAGQLVRGYPMVAAFRSRLAHLLREQARLSLALGNPSAAESSLTEAIRLTRRLREDYPQDTGTVLQLAETYLLSGHTARAMNDPTKARDFYQQVRQLVEAQGSLHRLPEALRTLEAQASRYRAGLEAAAGRWQAAQAELERAAACGAAPDVIAGDQLALAARQGQAARVLTDAAQAAQRTDLSAAAQAAYLRAVSLALPQLPSAARQQAEKLAMKLVQSLAPTLPAPPPTQGNGPPSAAAPPRQDPSRAAAWLELLSDPDYEAVRQLPEFRALQEAFRRATDR